MASPRNTRSSQTSRRQSSYSRQPSTRHAPRQSRSVGLGPSSADYSRRRHDRPDVPYRSYQDSPYGRATHSKQSGNGALGKIGSTIMWIWNKSKAVTVVLAVLIAFGCFMALDSAFTSSKILKGVSVGDVDVSNMTVEEAASAISATYEPRLASTTVYIFADEETANSDDLDLKILESDSLAEQLSFEEAQENKRLWITSAADLGASVPADDLANEAYNAGRGMGFISRMLTSINGESIEACASFDDASLSNLMSDINGALGYEMRDFGIEVADGCATVTEGNDGYMLDSAQFAGQLSDSLLSEDRSIVGFVAQLQFTPIHVTEQAATLTCDALNALVPSTVRFSMSSKDVDIWRNTLLGWVSTEPAEIEGPAERASDMGSCYLKPYIDPSIASSALLSFLEEGSDQGEVEVSYEFEGDDVFVQPNGEVAIPEVDDALRSLDSSLFDGFRSTLSFDGEVSVDPISVESRFSSDRLTLSDAITYGVVDAFSTFTTKYTNTSSTAGRTYNVHRAADLLNNSIAQADAKWSFNDAVGSCDEEHGFKEANVIEAGEYTTGIGGGICQVATTVFNAAYDAGLPIVERHNHSLYSSSYPAGRDAAIAYPDMDLIWKNNTSADILIRASYTDTSITVTLVGFDPKKQVSTETGEWKEGKNHGLRFEVNEDMAADTAYVKTAGTDGMEIAITRTVKDSDGNVELVDTFESIYAPITKVVVCGEGSDMDALRKKYGETSQ